MAALLGVVTMKIVTAWAVVGSCRSHRLGWMVDSAVIVAVVPACLGDVAALILGDSLQVGRLLPG